jgi:hypothetical protein
MPDDLEEREMLLMHTEKVRSESRDRVWKWLHEIPDTNSDDESDQPIKQRRGLLPTLFSRTHSPAISQNLNDSSDTRYSVGCFGSMLGFKLRRAESN